MAHINQLPYQRLSVSRRSQITPRDTSMYRALRSNVVCAARPHAGLRPTPTRLGVRCTETSHMPQRFLVQVYMVGPAHSRGF
eukprot:4591327-Prymnesium_polylepis.1